MRINTNGRPYVLINTQMQLKTELKKKKKDLTSLISIYLNVISTAALHQFNVKIMSKQKIRSIFVIHLI